MAKSAQLFKVSLAFLRFTSTASFARPRSIAVPSKLKLKLFSTTSTPYPLQYEMIVSRPVEPPRHHGRRRSLRSPIANSKPTESPEPDSELGFDDWVERKLSSTPSSSQRPDDRTNDTDTGMDKAKRKYYNKRRKRMFGSDSEDEGNRRDGSDFVELKQEVVELRTLHKKEEELHFYDAFAYPWEKDKHYKMVYQLEKKYFPDQCFDKAFLEPGQSNESTPKGKRKVVKSEDRKGEVADRGEDTGLVFFETEEKTENIESDNKDAKVDVSEKKVEEFFKCLKNVPNDSDRAGVSSAEPFFSSRNTGLPPKWDSPAGTVVLVNKPKGWTSFTVCGKLRRLTKVKKVGHAGTLDPMATGLLIVCVGKATKQVDRYQGMIKGYSGVFRLGEATSTWDADSPVIQREPWEHIKNEDLRKAAASLSGEIWQVPPMFSAIKVGGEKMYEKARRGESIELSPRRISIFQFDVERSLEDRQNVIFRVICSKGTYIRSLCADFGKALGSCAHLSALRRDSIGEYKANDAWEFQELEEAITKGYL
nr:haca ribonucleoprotein complex subunit 4 [Ipomoea batatas]